MSSISSNNLVTFQIGYNKHQVTINKTSDDKNLIVLQGEIAFTNSKDCSYVKTTCPTACHIIVFNSTNKLISGLAHIDDYTSVESIYVTANEILKNKYNTSFDECKFKATVIGGNADSFSLNQKKKILLFLKAKVEIQVYNLKDRTLQIRLNTNTGTFDTEPCDKYLELLQKKEYWIFNRFLDKKYALVNGDNIPFFKINPATRSVSDLPNFKFEGDLSTFNKIADALEDGKQVKYNYRAERQVFKN